MTDATTSPARWLEAMPLDAIAEAPRNPKAHAAGALARSVERFGYVEPMVLDERTGRLVAGHGRLADLRARQQRGEQPPEGVDPDGWLVPVVRGWRSRSDAEADAAGIALNRVGEAGGWQRDLLATVLSEMAELDGELLTATGFDSDDLDHLIAQFSAPPSLDELERQYGSFTDEDGWATVTIKAPQHVLAAWSRWAAGYGSDALAFEALLGDRVTLEVPGADLVDAGAAPPPEGL